MKKVYYLSTCDTCKKIMREAGISTANGFVLQDIKTEAVTSTQLDEMKRLSGSYEALFSRRAIKYKELGLKNKILSEREIRGLILKEYTFLKRPVVIINDRIFTGNEKKNVDALTNFLK